MEHAVLKGNMTALHSVTRVRAQNTSWSQCSLQLFTFLMGITVLLAHSAFPSSLGDTWMSVNSWRGSVEWFSRIGPCKCTLHSADCVWGCAHKQQHKCKYRHMPAHMHRSHHVQRLAAFLPHLSTLCPLLLSFSTCLWSSASFTFQSTVCFSSSWQWSEHGEWEQKKRELSPLGS